MDPITNQAPGFQQTQTTRVRDPGIVLDANPPPPPEAERPASESSSPHPFRGHHLNTVA